MNSGKLVKCLEIHRHVANVQTLKLIFKTERFAFTELIMIAY